MRRPNAADLTVLSLALILVSGCGDPKIEGAGGPLALGATVDNAVRIQLSKRPSFSSLAGGQWCRVLWTDASWRIVPGPFPYDGELSTWRHDTGKWVLSDVLNFERGMNEGLERDSLLVRDPEPAQPIRFIVASGRGPFQPGDHSKAVRLEGATVVLVAGRFGTPSWDPPTSRSGGNGVVEFPPLRGDMWYSDINAAGHARVRWPAPIGYAKDEELRWFVLYPGSEVKGRVAVAGRSPPVDTEVRVAFPEMVGSLDLCYPLSPAGEFTIIEPRDVTTLYEITLPDGRSMEKRRLHASDALTFKFP